MTIEQGTKLHKEFKELTNDKDRLDFLVTNKEHLMIMLDNDNSTAVFIDCDIPEDDACDFYFNFKGYFGCSDNVVLLFEKLGVRAEIV